MCPSPLLRAGIEDLLEGMSDAFVALDTDWTYVYVNRQAGELFGRTPEDLVGRHIWTEFPDGVGQAFYNAYHRAMDTQRPVVIEDYYPPWDRWFENRIHPSRDGLLIFFHDITDRKRAEAALRAEEDRRREAERGLVEADDRMRALMDASSSPQWVKALDGTYLLANAALGRFFGRSPAELVGTVCYTLLDEPVRSQIHALDRRVIETDAPASAEIRIPCPDGDTTYLLQVFPLPGRDARTRHIGGVATDITERVRIAEALRTREHQLLEAQRIARFASFAIEAASGRVVPSAELARIYRLPPGADVTDARTYLDMLHPDDAERVEAAFRAAVTRGERLDMTFRIVFPDDTVGWFTSVGEAEVDDAGAVVRLVGVSRDVTEEHLRTEELRNRERLLTEAQRIGRIGSFERDFAADRDTWSDELFRIYGLDVSATPSLDLFGTLLHPDDRDAALATVRAAYVTGGPFRLTPRIVRPDGEVRHLDTYGYVDLDGDGRPLRVVGVSQDVTESRESERHLLRLTERLRLLHDIDMAILGAETEAEVADRALARMVEILGADAVVLLDTGGAVVSAAPAGAPPHDDPGWGAVVPTPLSSDDGPLGRLVLLARDPDALGAEQRAVAVEVAAQLAIAVTQGRLRDRVRAYSQELEERVAERTRDLEDANADLESFSYSVAHDLRAPLRALQGLSLALAEDYGDVLDDLGRDYCARIVRAADRMDLLIQDLLAYARLSRSEPRMGFVALDAVMHEVLAQLGGEVERTGARVTVDGPLPDVTGHAATLVQVVGNLVSNALKFTPAGEPPVVTVSGARTGGTVRLTVRDDGIGIDPAYHDRIFRIFERLHGTESYPGTGIGLAIVRRGMERMNGHAGVEAPAGGGSVFWIELPAADAAVAAG